MPKRKRSSEQTLQQKLDKSADEVFRALKLAKGFERQRQDKRLHEKGIEPDKKQRLEREITVLKSIDLRQTARAHLYSSLLKIKSVAASTSLPDEIRNGVPKPEISEEERVALHNVTSGLYNRKPVKDAMENAVVSVCESLDVPVPEKGGKREKKTKRGDQEDQPSDRIPASSSKTAVDTEGGDGLLAGGQKQAGMEVDEDVTDFEGFESDVDEPSPSEQEDEEEEEKEDDFDSGDNFEEEAAVSKYDHLLGSSSDEDSNDGLGEDILERLRGTEKVDLDDISLSGSEPTPGSESDIESASESDEPISQPPQPSNTKQQKDKKPKSSSKSKTSAASAAAPVRDSTFLPSLMGGYISGSESASSIDVAPAKKRRGQRARQAIHEKKYGAKANHLRNENNGGKRGGGGRDAGWDMQRGAVDGDDRGRGRTPWKRGLGNPLARQQQRDDHRMEQQQQPPPAPRTKDDQGKLHPSWEARKKAKDAEKAVAFTGSKITFD